MKPFVYLFAIACTAILGVALFFIFQGSSDTGRLIQLDPMFTQRDTVGYWAQGSTNPKVVLTEYSDFQCLACVKEFSVIQGAMTKLSSTVQFRFKNFINAPDKNGQQAAQGAEAAGAQGKYWEMYQIIYANFNTWTSQSPTDFRSSLGIYAKNIGLNINQFNQDLDNSTTEDEIDSDKSDSITAQVKSAPTMFINGQKVIDLPQTSDELVGLLTQAASK